MILKLKRHLYTTKLWNRIAKNQKELRSWVESMEKMIKWYKGEDPYHYPFPKEEEKEKRFDLKKNAVMTYIATEIKFARYASNLWLKFDSFRGKRIADIGSGPIPTLLVFSECERYCIDHLIDKYRAVGYPLEEYESEITFVNSKAERIPFPDDFIDIVISRNALDHVDNFEQAAAEIKRILRPNGAIHLLINYHRPASTEPLALNDSGIIGSLGDLNPRKIYEEIDAWGFDGGKTVLWSTLPCESLRACSLVLSRVEVIRIVNNFVDHLLKKKYYVRGVYLLGSFAWGKQDLYKHIQLAIVLGSRENQDESSSAEYFNIFLEARKFNPLLEVVCVRQEEIDRDADALVKQIRKDAIRLF